MNSQRKFKELTINQQDDDFIMTKLWHSVQKKYKRIFKKRKSLDRIEYTNSDNESDKTNNEIKKPYKGRKANSTRSNEKTLNSNYDKRDNSLDIIRNEDDNYEVVLPYQRIVKSYV